nr:hypothetical protein CFP56_09296 [Quercus suber]
MVMHVAPRVLTRGSATAGSARHRFLQYFGLSVSRSLVVEPRATSLSAAGPRSLRHGTCYTSLEHGSSVLETYSFGMSGRCTLQSRQDISILGCFIMNSMTEEGRSDFLQLIIRQVRLKWSSGLQDSSGPSMATRALRFRRTVEAFSPYRSSFRNIRETPVATAPASKPIVLDSRALCVCRKGRLVAEDGSHIPLARHVRELLQYNKTLPSPPYPHGVMLVALRPGHCAKRKSVHHLVNPRLPRVAEPIYLPDPVSLAWPRICHSGHNEMTRLLPAQSRVQRKTTSQCYTHQVSDVPEIEPLETRRINIYITSTRCSCNFCAWYAAHNQHDSRGSSMRSAIGKVFQLGTNYNTMDIK